ncbi:MAG TPA: serine/threonine-protein kinase [Gemmatimonadales bacterium]|nr:serine/threonine-protein kinase [Gemmatimonadales bacterium]
MSGTLDRLFLRFQAALAGRYSLERELGRGGMGIVYLARDVRLDRPVAIKLLPPEKGASTVLRERFLQEARTAAKLSHPHVVPIHAVDEAGEFVFFVMAYIEGETLGHRVRTRGPVAPAEAGRVLREVAWALAYAHAQGVVHRDVKPENILLEAGTGRALVADFGIARVAEVTGLTVGGGLVGTPEFMSPEQASGDPVDPRSDLYSLGIVGFYALSGRLPFVATSIPEVLALQISEPAPPVATVAPATPRRLAQVVDRCLAKDPAARFQRGESVADAIALSVQPRPEAPLPVRLFLTEQKNLSALQLFYLLLIAAVSARIFFPLIFAEFLTVVQNQVPRVHEVVVDLLPGALVALVVLAPAALLLYRVRRLLRAGSRRRDLLDALKTAWQRRREELATAYGRRPRWLERAVYRVWVACVAAGAASGLAALVVPIGSAALVVLLATFSVAVVIGVLCYGTGTRVHLAQGGQLRFWRGPVGRWLFGMAGAGVAARPTVIPVTHRPTEFAVGGAAEALFEALPKPRRAHLPAVPGIIRRLEGTAQRMRARVEECAELLTRVGPDAAGARSATLRAGAPEAEALAERRKALRADLGAARDAAQRYLAEAVASLEAIRLDLMRLRAGVGGMESIAADLTAAARLADEADRLLETQGVVARVAEESPAVTPDRTPEGEMNGYR